MARSSKAPEERRQEIIDTAFRLFCEKGYEQTAVRDIVGSIGVAQGLFYYYFKNKEEAFFAVAQQYGEQMMEALAQIIERRALSPLQRVQAALGVITEFLYNNSFWQQLPADLSPRMHLRMQQMTRELLEEPLANMLAQGTEQGEFSVSHPLYTARFILSGFIGLAVDPGHPPTQEILVLIQQFIARILGVPEDTLLHPEGAISSEG